MKFEISSMLNPDVYDHPVSEIELIETHISWVVLTGNFAYKIKKPVDFGFLDFSTLDKRKEFCEQELQLNRRLAADIYLEVVSISGTTDKPEISVGLDESEAFEVAVKMKQFPQSAQFDNLLEAGGLGVEHIDALALMVADFHQRTKIASKSMRYGRKDKVYQPVKDNFELISESLKTDVYESKLATLKQWSFTEFIKHEAVFEQRKKDGFVRECHGDMHLRNLVWLDDKPVAFDCIEFNPDLRWIDVISEVAFLIMDLQDRQQDQLANHFLNRYLEITGDYAGLKVLPFYLCYRVMVRAKVEVLRIQQIESVKKTDKGVGNKVQELAELESYLNLAVRYTKSLTPILIVMRGLSASGKSSVSKQLLATLDTGHKTNAVIRIRSDVERKRLFQVPPNVKASSSINRGIYTKEVSQQTYDKLLLLASEIITAGFSVIVDAAFLKHRQRKPFQDLAKQLSVPYVILEVTAHVDVLRERIVARKNDVSDADLAVLNHQILEWKALHQDELKSAISINTEEPLDFLELMNSINNKYEW